MSDGSTFTLTGASALDIAALEDVLPGQAFQREPAAQGGAYINLVDGQVIVQIVDGLIPVLAGWLATRNIQAVRRTKQKDGSTKETIINLDSKGSAHAPEDVQGALTEDT
jgi:hypothetical protein